MRVTIKHIAKAAKVSHTTVSRVFHQDPRISDPTKKRVLRIAKQLNYRPNIMARGLVKKQTYLIGLIVPDIMSSFFPEIIQGIEEIAAEKGYSIILCTSENDTGRETEYIDLLIRKGVDGLIISPVFGSDIVDIDEIISQEKKPVVYIGALVHGVKGLFVGVNDENIGYIATKHLLQLGHRELAHLAGNPQVLQSLHRLQGFRKALLEFGISSARKRVIPSGYSISAGAEAMKKVLQLHPRPTAVYAVCDTAAIGAMQTIRKTKLSIPGDIAVVGTDDLNIAELIEVPLTTVSQPKYKMGATAADKLIQKINREPVKDTVLETKLVIRDSCGAKKSKS
ncbi:MAG: LacI family DNA-binding transcriptional regulator [bacterium]|nr:LacI family DNA-binding transcriptional regulator [bacterium]